VSWEVVIGLEVHCQLRTRSKLFSASPVSYGAEPNHSVTPLDLALPGTLPVLNGAAVELAIRAALATHCSVHERSIFARKNYFYPDLPKGYQISQYEEPLATGGWVEIESASGAPLRVRLTRIHMEEDAGKSIHDQSTTETLIDLNRAGVPLIEIVSEPDLRSAADAAEYLRKLREIVRAVGASDADMEKGQFRCDANVSLRRPGDPRLGTRTEIKNLNSFRFVEAAIQREVRRQAEILESGGAIVQATMGYEAEHDRIYTMRTKENADDYRYFPDPDLIPVAIPAARIEAIRAALPELPEARAQRLEASGVPPGDARRLAVSNAISAWYEAAAGSGGAPQQRKLVAAWMTRDVLPALKERDAEIERVKLAPDAFRELVTLADDGKVTAKTARTLLAELLWTGGDPAALIAERGLGALSDTGALEAIADEVIAANEKAVAAVRAGDAKSLNFLMGQLMRRTQGKADPAAVREILERKLGGGVR
jgi:aspartyl-tRNA(Asn)/glutamyl-tRNA(Gln) amidotransferase subunit B